MARLDRLVDRLIDAAADAAAERRWPDVVELPRDVLVLEPDNDEARRLLALSETKIGVPTHEQRVTPQLRQLTVLMCDQEDSSGFSDRHDAETVQDRRRLPQGRPLGGGRHGGKIHHHQGDGVLAYFGFPRGQEDAAGRAVEAGLDLLREVKGLQARIASDLAEHLVVRVAVHTDTAVVADFEEAVRSRSAALSGRIGNLASRLQQLADDRSIIISESTYELVRDDFVTEPLGPVSLRGFSASVEAYRIDADATRLDADRPRSALFVGRDAERAELLATWDEVKASRGGATVVVADPGVGKSRLIREIEQTVSDDGGQVLRTACAEASRAEQWHAVRRLIGAVAGLRHDDDNEVRWTKLGESLAPVVPDPARDLPLLALVVGVPADGRYALPDLHPAALRELTLKCAVDVLVHLAAAAPTLLIVEDLHWCDPSSWELLTRLVAVSTSEPLWVLMASRQIGPAEELGASILRVGELSDEDATTLALLAHRRCRRQDGRRPQQRRAAVHRGAGGQRRPRTRAGRTAHAARPVPVATRCGRSPGASGRPGVGNDRTRRRGAVARRRAHQARPRRADVRPCHAHVARRRGRRTGAGARGTGAALPPRALPGGRVRQPARHRAAGAPQLRRRRAHQPGDAVREPARRRHRPPPHVGRPLERGDGVLRRRHPAGAVERRLRREPPAARRRARCR